MKKQISQISNFEQKFSSEKVDEYLWDWLTHSFFEDGDLTFIKKHGSNTMFWFKLLRLYLRYCSEEAAGAIHTDQNYEILKDYYDADDMISYLENMFFSYITSEVYLACINDQREHVQMFLDLRSLMTEYNPFKKLAEEVPAEI